MRRASIDHVVHSLRGPGIATAIHYTLGALLAFGALNAFGGGYYGLSGAKDVPKEWLEGSPFTDYLIPSMVLFFVVGGSFLVAAVAVFARWPRARFLAIGAGAVALAWLAVQVAIIGYVSWMQPMTALVALSMLVLAMLLPHRGAEMPFPWMNTSPARKQS